MKIVYHGKVSGGCLRIANRKLFDKELEQHEGKEVEITIIRKRRIRSTQQNRYYWGIVLPLIIDGLKELGTRVDVEDVHSFLKSKFCTIQVVNEETGQVEQVPKSTTELTTTGFMEYKAEIQQWAAEFLGISIPDPNEQIEFKY